MAHFMRSDVQMLTHDGETLSIRAWAKRLGLNPQTLAKRLKNGWTLATLMTAPKDLRTYRREAEIEYQGKSQVLDAWAIELGINIATLRSRLRSGKTVQQAFTEPVQTKRRPRRHGINRYFP
ncbi:MULTISPECIES: hypothetical protein [unclassified Beijerinckia]|uniref:hypothetical protein n=1 Tax=unclassified Beijerinckia TaxID=2638183 RepID=UPI0011150390|nr:MULTISPECIES: hypothetical protein [unclassified Beijerinckia]